MSKNNQYFIYNSEGFSEESVKDLDMELCKLGLKDYKPEGLGGGPSEIVQQIIIWINLHDFWSGLLIGILVNRVDKIIDTIISWLNKNKVNGDRNVSYVIDICIFENIKYYKATFDLNNSYSKEIIRKILNNSKRNNSRRFK